MLTGVHILLTYRCTSQCDHCFVYSSPDAEGTMSLSQVRRVLDESKRLPNVEWIYFEGGEPFLYYPTMLEGIRLAREMGFRVGIVTNSYWAVTEEDAEVGLRPLAQLGIEDLSVSDDAFHLREDEEPTAANVLAAARGLGIPASAICIEKPYVEAAPGQGQEKGAPVIGGGAMFKGRAVDQLTSGLPRRSWETLTQCPYEELLSPSRVHVDPYGHVHLCQGLSMGNLWERSLADLLAEHAADPGPICGPLLQGGPALLARHHGVEHEDSYVDECHLCFELRRALLDRFPRCLAPRQVYGR